MVTLPTKGLYAITDCEHLNTEDLITKTEGILQSGAVLLQYRNKSNNTGLKHEQAKLLQELSKKYHVPFIINDDVELARKIHADGVHLGRDDTTCKNARNLLGPDRIVGVSCYNDLERAVNMQENGASYIAFGAFFPTQTKNNTVKSDPVLLIEAKKILSVPIVAIGGITPENGKVLIDSGADFLAVINGIYSPPDPSEAARVYTNLFKS